jgi:shikimate kinase
MQDDMRVSFYDIKYFCLYFSYFGFWEVTPKKTFAEQGYPDRIFSAESITPTVFGVTIAPLLREARALLEWNLPHRRKLGEYKPVPGSPVPGEEIYAFLAGSHKRKKPGSTIKVKKGKPGDPFFLPFVHLVARGELQKTLPRGESKPIDGTFVFKVSLNKSIWRRIELSSDHTLLDLHNSIQRAYGFDDDHLYSFFMDGKMPSDEVFTSPNDDTGPHVDVVRIGDLELTVEQNILYLFDYGDMWRFLVELEEIRTEGIKPGNPMIIESKGKSPIQYGSSEK